MNLREDDIVSAVALVMDEDTDPDAPPILPEVGESGPVEPDAPQPDPEEPVDELPDDPQDDTSSPSDESA